MSLPKLQIMRVSPTNEEACSNYQLAKLDIEMTGFCKWNGKLAVGDYFGFIVGPKEKEVCEFYKVKEVLPDSECEKWWKKGYMWPILLTSEHELPPKWNWQEIKKSVGLAPNVPWWMPLHTQPVKDAYKLPFSNPFRPANNGLDLISSLY
jgi:hypothetical protein